MHSFLSLTSHKQETDLTLPPTHIHTHTLVPKGTCTYRLQVFMPQQSHTQDTTWPPNFLPYEKAIKFMQDLLWKQPWVCFFPCCLIAFVVYTCNIALFGPNMGEFWKQNRFPTISSSYEAWSHSSFFPYHFTKKRLFLFVALLKNSSRSRQGVRPGSFQFGHSRICM